MKAIYFKETGSVEKIQFGELDLARPKLGESELRLKFRAGSLNHLDLWVLLGLPHLRYEFPHIAGADFCGEVLESSSSKFQVGDRVVLYPAAGSKSPENLSSDFHIRGESMHGVFVEEICVSDRYAFKPPSYMSDEEAAAFPLVYLTAWQMLTEKAEITVGWKRGPVLVHGAGSGVSQALLEILLALKIPNLVVTSRSKDKLENWKERGVETFIWSDNLYSELKKFSGPSRFAVIFDHVGQQSFEMNIKLLANAGRLVSCGSTSGYEVKLDLRQIFFRQLQILGSTMGSLQHFKDLIAFLKQHQMRPQISKIYAMNQVASAYEEMARGAQNGKIVLKPMH